MTDPKLHSYTLTYRRPSRGERCAMTVLAPSPAKAREAIREYEVSRGFRAVFDADADGYEGPRLSESADPDA